LVPESGLTPGAGDTSPHDDGIGRGRLRRAGPIAATALVTCVTLAFASAGWSSETLSVSARFAPDSADVPTNFSLTASFSSSTGLPPSPIKRFTLYAPAGMEVDPRGVDTCAAAALEERGPAGCPPDSRAGFGGGVGVLELPTETVHEPYTLDFFFAAKARGHLRLLIYASGDAPASVELVLIAKQVPAPKPYGLGFSVEVPPVSTFPSAPDASIESAFVTVGGHNVAYYEPVAGRRELVHLRGIVAPKRCPGGGFPTEGTVDFADGAALTVKSTIPCPSSS
jgi:hypothetical protein